MGANNIQKVNRLKVELLGKKSISKLMLQFQNQ